MDKTMTFFRNLKETMCSSENPIMSQCFDRSELSDKKRPETVATQFKMSLLQLVEILKSKEPAYVRCIKPNDAKQPGRFDEVLIRHQVKYLGLMENLRVRRAGFAYRRKYEAFLQRYKSLCPETWPTWKGRPRMGWLCWSDTWAISQKSTRWAGRRSSSASPRPCLPQRMPWRSGGRAWPRRSRLPGGAFTGDRNSCG